MVVNKKGGDLVLWNCSGWLVVGLFVIDIGGEVLIWDNDGG